MDILKAASSDNNVEKDSDPKAIPHEAGDISTVLKFVRANLDFTVNVYF